MLSILKTFSDCSRTLVSPLVKIPAYQFFSNEAQQNKIKKAAVILAGCGVMDGSETTETISFFIALSENKIPFDVFAPNKEQTEVVNHVTGKATNEKRNVMVESARLSRGKIKDLKELKHADYDAVFMPGGFGAAKNLSTFATKGADMQVDETLASILKDFHANKKPIALACISPIIAASLFGKQGVKLTLGKKGENWPYSEAIDVATKLGAKHKEKSVSDSCFDKENLIFTTPAFMKETNDFSEIYKGVSRFVEKVLEKTNNS